MFVSFVLVGALNTICNGVLFLVLLLFLHYGVAYTITFVSGIACGYVLNSGLVFESEFSKRSAIRFVTVYVAQYFWGFTVLALLIDGLHAPSYVAVAIFVVTSAPFAFLLVERALKPQDTVTCDLAQPTIERSK